jgi:hypothetical protein
MRFLKRKGGGWVHTSSYNLVFAIKIIRIFLNLCFFDRKTNLLVIISISSILHQQISTIYIHTCCSLHPCEIPEVCQQAMV